LAILKETARLREDLLQFDKGARGTIRFLANTNAINEFLPTLLASFLSQNPQVNVEMQESTSQEIVQRVEAGNADVGIIATGVGTRNLEIHPFRDDHLVLVTPENHVLATQPSVRFHQVLEWEFIGMADRASLQLWMVKTAMLLGQTMQMRIQVGNFDAICRLVEAGAGVSIIPESSARRLQKSMRFRIVALDEDWAQRNLKVVVRTLSALPAHARKLFDHLTTAV
jgi:DNA-binding transcriptional LysR family regulator